ncbi:MAG: hypothetical protein ACI9GK_000662 [Devosia sp.]|jgi:hypothetical protein|tara:strand:- start:18365 stop:18652 length:288 start_codon:yes stop_codon:yes gene_type:complete
MVTVYALYVSKAIRATTLGGRITIKLLRILNDWAKAQKAEEVHVHVTSGVQPERTDRLLRRLGYRRMGGIMRSGGHRKSLKALATVFCRAPHHEY